MEPKQRIEEPGTASWVRARKSSSSSMLNTSCRLIRGTAWVTSPKVFTA